MIRLPIKTYLHKYLCQEIGAEKIEIKKISAADIDSNIKRWQYLLSKNLFPYLTHSTGFQGDPKRILNSPYTLIAVMPSDKMIRHKRLDITSQGITKVNECIQGEFYKDLFAELDLCLVEKKRIDHKIIDFMNKYDINEDDIRFDSLKKAHYRSRIKEGNNFEKVEPYCVVDLFFGNRLVQ